MPAGLLKPSSFAELAQRRVEQAGALSLEDCPRLAERLLPHPDTAIEGYVALHLSEKGEVIADGWVKARVYAPCSRCMEPVQLDIHSPFQVQIVKALTEAPSGELTAEHGEFYLAPDGQGRLADLFEDETLLGLAQYPAHEQEAQCGEVGNYLNKYEYQAAEAATEKSHPFAVLQQLKSSAEPEGNSGSD